MMLTLMLMLTLMPTLTLTLMLTLTLWLTLMLMLTLTLMPMLTSTPSLTLTPSLTCEQKWLEITTPCLLGIKDASGKTLIMTTSSGRTVFASSCLNWEEEELIGTRPDHQ
jgi:hypothetical protein